MSCDKNNLAPNNYVKWIEDKSNGIKKIKELKPLRLELQYKPIDYLVLRNKEDRQTNANQTANIRSEYEGLQYYQFKIGLVSQSQDLLHFRIKNNNEYSERIEYFSFYVCDDIRLIDGNDTLRSVICHFERTYGLVPYVNLSLAFEVDNSKEIRDKILIYNDQLFGIGPVKIRIKSSDINSIPTLKII